MSPSLRPLRFRRPERTDRLPADIRTVAGLARGEKLLAHARLADGGWALATSAALVLVGSDALVGPDGAPAVTGRHPWHEVAEATWDPETNVIAVQWADTACPELTVALTEQSGHLPEVLRERVMSTYVLSQRLLVRGRRGVTVAVRQHSADGTLFTQTVPDEGIDLGRPQTAAQVEALLRDLSEKVGLRR